MKKILLGIALLMIFLSATIEVQAATYPDCGVVMETQNGYVTYITMNGNVWKTYSPSEDWLIGDMIAVIRDDNGTPNIYDDKELSSRYCGYVNEIMLEDMSEMYSQFKLRRTK